MKGREKFTIFKKPPSLFHRKWTENSRRAATLFSNGDDPFLLTHWPKKMILGTAKTKFFGGKEGHNILGA